LNSGESWDSVAKRFGPAPQPGKFVSRSDATVPIEIRRDAFESAKPAGKPVYERLALANGDDDVLAVLAVRNDPGADAQEPEAQLRAQAAQQSASSEAQSYAAAARADAKVIVNPQALD
jgi:hypothetical protein